LDKSDTIKERIKFYTEILKLIATFSFITAGGTVGLFFKLKDPISIPFILFGIVLTVGFLTVVAYLLGTIKSLFERLEKCGK
jgi:Na+-transporting NADH:ubiquinone oxidoreductase subunit NqrB